MQKIVTLTTLLLLAGVLALSGCATNRGVVSLELPEETVKAEPNGLEVFIEAVTDERVFEENPKRQDIPSLGFGGSDGATKEIKKRAIARKRNGYGKAMGDILLQEGQTVESVITDTLERACAEKGYKVVTSRQEVTDKTLVINARIYKFWAYMTPGFWAITLSSDISTLLEFSHDSSKTSTVTVHSDGKYQIATGMNWMEVIDLSVQKYIDEVKKVL